MIFEENYHTQGGAKLPVLAFYAIYTLLIKETNRYEKSKLKPMKSHTASDKKSDSAGDIEIEKDGGIFEVLEIKLNKSPDLHTLHIAREKIIKFNPKRYYIFSNHDCDEKIRKEMDELVNRIKEEHGCQIIINGLYETIRYYLRLISNPDLFLNEYIKQVSNDKELATLHKEKLKEILISKGIFDNE